MTELRFGDSDALRCRFVVSPLWETLAAVRLLKDHHHRPLYLPWLEAHAETAAGLDLDVLRAVQPHTGYTPDFLAPPPGATGAAFHTELARVRATPVDRVVAELTQSLDQSTNPYASHLEQLLADPSATRDLLADTMASAWTALIQPDWPAIRRVLDDDIAYRGHQLTTGGLAALFDDLHPTLTWIENRLVATRYRDRDRDLSGAGLLLVPSVFTWPYLSLFVDPVYQPSLVYPARGAARLWTDAPHPHPTGSPISSAAPAPRCSRRSTHPPPPPTWRGSTGWPWLPSPGTSPPCTPPDLPLAAAPVTRCTTAVPTSDRLSLTPPSSSRPQAGN